MNRKLILNKETIAQLTNPDRIFGGEGAGGPITHSCDGTCVGFTCEGESCDGTFCPTEAVTCGNKYSCNPPPLVACHLDQM